MRRWILAAASTSLAALLLAPTAGADTNISDRTYVRHDGGSDVTIASCNDDSPGTTAAGERQQNEPTAAVNPLNTLKLTSGANDYCPVPTTTDAWAGFYYSGNGGATWVNSLLPGYPTDTSAEGRASPLFGLVTSAGDPVQDWDRSNHVYYGGIAFNRAKPANGSIWVARYNWGPPFAAPDHEFTTLVSRGTPSPIFAGPLRGQDRARGRRRRRQPVRRATSTSAGPASPARGRTTSSNSPAQPTAAARGRRRRSPSRSTASRAATSRSRGRGWSSSTGGSTPSSRIRGRGKRDAIAWARSSDGGATFTKPAVCARIPALGHERRHARPRSPTGSPLPGVPGGGDGTLGGCSGPEPRADARDCGDGPLACDSGYVFGRVDSSPRNAADPVAGQGDEAYVVIEATVPGTQRPSGTSYNTLEEGVASQGSIYFTKTENAGATWTPLVRIDPQARGNQFYPDIDANAGRLHAMWQDTRASTATGPDGSWITVPFENQCGAGEPARCGLERLRRPDVLRHRGRDGWRLDDHTGLVRHVQAELGAVRQPRRPVLRGLQLRLGRRLEGAADVDRRPETRSPGRIRGTRTGTAPTASTSASAARQNPDGTLERRHLCERGRPRSEHLGARPRLAVRRQRRRAGACRPFVS